MRLKEANGAPGPDRTDTSAPAWLWRTDAGNSVDGITAIIPATGLFRHLPTNVRKSAGRVSWGHRLAE
jgi:hypothetical protein